MQETEVNATQALRASIALGIAGCIYGAFLVITKVANNNGYMREDLMPGQYLFALAVFSILVLAKYRHVRLKGKQRFRLVIIGALGFGVNFCLYETVAVTSGSFAVTMLFQCIWMGIALDSLITRILPTKFMIIAGVLVILGMPLATGLLDEGSAVNVPGLLWGFGSAVCYAGMLWTSGHFETQVTPVIRTFYFALTQAVLSSLAAPSFFTGSVFDPVAWSYAIPLGLCTGVVPVLIIMRNSPKVPTGITTIMVGMEMPSTVILEMIFLRQEQTVLSIAGVVLICVGIVAANKDGITEFRKQRALIKAEEKSP